MTSPSFTILGENIDLIRPKASKMPIIYKADRPRTPSCWTPPKTIKEHSGKVIGPCLKDSDGVVYLLFYGCHFTVLEVFKLNPDKIINSGFFLENGNFIWR